MIKKGLYGLSTVNVELTSLCNKNCWMCGRRKIEREYPELVKEYGHMDFQLVEKISKQLPPNIVVQLHNNGEPLVYPHFGDATKLFKNQITNIDTNGKLLVEKSDEIIDNLDTLAISVIENDEEGEEQFEIIRKFLKIKKNRKPLTLLRINGDVDIKKYKEFNLLMATRILHAPMGSFNYRKRSATIPEIGICLDFLHHMAIDRKGVVSICVRFDPQRLGVIGDANKHTLSEIWNSPQRMRWLEYHKQGRRDKIPLCSYCHFWGVPTSNINIENFFKINVNDIFNK